MSPVNSSLSVIPIDLILHFGDHEEVRGRSGLEFQSASNLLCLGILSTWNLELREEKTS